MSQNQEVIDSGALITTPFARAVFLQLNALLSYKSVSMLLKSQVSHFIELWA